MGVRAAIIGVSLLLALGACGRKESAQRGNEIPASNAPAQTAPGASRAAARPVPFELLGSYADTSKDRPSGCLRFSRPLDLRPEAHYADYVRLTPATDSALTVGESTLCFDGLSFGKSYRVTITVGLPARDGTRLARATTAAIEFGEREPLVGFAGSGYVLARDGSIGVTVDTVNIERVAIEVLRVGDRMLPSMLPQLRTKQQADRWTLDQMIEGSARPVWSGTMDVESTPNATAHTAFALAQAVPERQPGAYLIVAAKAAGLKPRAKDAKFLWERTDNDQFAAQWVIVTDVALTAVKAADGLHVVARSLASAAPIAGVALDLLARDQQVLGHAVTGSDGGAVFAPGLLRGEAAATAAALFAYGGNGDFAVLDLTAPAFDLSDRGVGGREAPGPVDVFVYTDRGIYRPGETVHAMALMRDRVGAAIADAPLTLVLRRPNGLEFKRATLQPQPGGGFALSVDLPEGASRGGWSVEALDADDKPVGRTKIEVQDFVPQRLKVQASSQAKVLHAGDEVSVAIDGRFLYGAPAGELPAEGHMKLAVDEAPFPQAQQGFRFGVPNPHFAPPEIELDTGETDKDGHAVATAKVPQPEGSENLPVKAEITVGIAEPGGRVTTDTLILPIRRPGHSIGIRPRFRDGRVAEQGTAGFEVIAVDENGTPVAAHLHWTLIEETPRYDWLQEDGRWSYHVSYTDNPVQAGDLDVSADRPAVLEHAVGWGGYRLVVEQPGTGVASSLAFNAGWAAASEAPDTPDKVEVSLEKDRYAVGETARVRVIPPFAGHLQVMVARDRVFATRELEVPKEGATVEVPVAADWGSGAYFLASLYRPADGGRGHLPIRAIGLAWAGIDPGAHKLQVELKVPDVVRPRQTVQVPIKVAGGSGAYVTLAAVDEGILQLTRFATPDPDDFYFGKRRLGAEIRDDYGRLLDGTAGTVGRLRAGGDEMGGRGLAVVPTRSVSLFSGPVPVGNDGAVTVPLDIPDFEGSLRLMAVVYSADGVGHAEANLVVRDPVVADVTLPRFLAPGDQAELTLLVDNRDGAAGTYTVALASTGAVSVGSKPLAYTLAKGERKIDRLPISGIDEGIGTVAASLTGPGTSIRREWSISVRGAHYPITLAGSALQADGQSFTLDKRMLDAFVPGSVSVSLGYSRLAGIDVPGLLQSLERYPYGCTEQLASVAFPLLYYEDAALNGLAAHDKGVRPRVQAAIDRIIDRQNGDGSFGLWRAGDRLGSEWLSLYVLDFLNHARAAGYTVPDGALLRSYGFAEDAVANALAGPPRGGDSHPSEDEAYAQWLLAQAHRADLGRLRMMHDAMQHTATLVAWDQKGTVPAQPLAVAQLSGALAVLGDRARAVDSMQEAVDAVMRPHVLEWWVAWNYWSNLRDAAGLLAVAAESDQLRLIQPILPKLQQLSRTPDALTTQEKAWLLAAAHAVSGGEADVGLAVNGQPFQGSKGQAALRPSPGEIAAGYTIENRSGHDLYRDIIVHGSPKNAPSAMGEGIGLVKTFLTLDGQPLDATRLTQNQRFIVLLQGGATDVALHHLVLVDPLPAGWEIEAALQPEQAPDFLPHLTKARLHEARDDRLVEAIDVGVRPWNDAEEDDEESDNASGDPEKDKAAQAARAENRHGKFAAAYVVRAVTTGSFVLPEAVVEDMYRPGTMARTQAAGTTIRAP